LGQGFLMLRPINLGDESKTTYFVDDNGMLFYDEAGKEPLLTGAGPSNAGGVSSYNWEAPAKLENGQIAPSSTGHSYPIEGPGANLPQSSYRAYAAARGWPKQYEDATVEQQREYSNWMVNQPDNQAYVAQAEKAGDKPLMESLGILAALAGGAYGLNALGAGAGAGAAAGEAGAAGVAGDAGLYSLAAPGAGIGGIGSAGLGLNAGTGISSLTGVTGSALGGAGALAGAADPIEALYMASQATGIDTATGAAAALGYSSPEAMLAAVNPAWVSSGALTQLASKATDLIKSSGGESSGSVWDSILSNKGLGNLLGTGLGLLGANAQQNAAGDLADKYWGAGEPYRQRLSSLYSNPASFLTSPEVTTSVDQGTNALARSLSAKVGNPVGSGTALQELQNYSTNSLYGQLGAEKNRLAQFGGLSSINSAIPATGAAAASTSGNLWNVAGSGLANVFNPAPTQDQSLAKILEMMKNNGIFNTAGSY
jgi:hypothetical protein